MNETIDLKNPEQDREAREAAAKAAAEEAAVEEEAVVINLLVYPCIMTIMVIDIYSMLVIGNLTEYILILPLTQMHLNLE